MAREWPDRSGEMEVLAQVVAAGSLSAAGRQLGLTPSGVSRVLRRLETRLGVRLLVRTTRALALTSEGEEYHRACLRILEDMRLAEQLVSDHAAPRGTLRVNATLPFGQRVLLPLLPGFLERYPGIDVDITLSDGVVDLVDQRADVAIRVGALPDSALTGRKLFDNRRLVVAAPAYLHRHGNPGRPEELAGHNCLEFNFRRLPGGWAFQVDGREILVPVSGNLQASNGEALRMLAVAGLGVARLGAFLVAEDLAAGRLVRLLPSFEPLRTEPVHAVFMGGPDIPARVRVFVDFLCGKLHEQGGEQEPSSSGHGPSRR